MHPKTDILIIGSGLGGLVCGSILAQAGLKVLILEKNRQIGGNLQTFVRNKCIFDTGVHYLGGLAKGQPLWQLFQYLGLGSLELQAMDSQGFDRIHFEGDPVHYPIAQGFTSFIQQLSAYFPTEKKGLEAYVELIKTYQQAFPLFQLSTDAAYPAGLDWHLTADEGIASCVQHPTLRAVLAGNNFLYAGQKDKTPFYVHALSVGSYLMSAWRCPKGGSQLAKGLAQKIRAHGGRILTRQEVIRMDGAEGQIEQVYTSRGEVFEAKDIIVNIHPRQWMSKVQGISFRPHYIKRIAAKKDTISSFSIFLVLKPKKLPYKGHNDYWFAQKEAVWDAINYDQDQWPQMYMLSMTECRKNPGYAESVSILTYMRYEEVVKWANSVHTVDHKDAPRGEGYEAFKTYKMKRLLNRAIARSPELEEAIHQIYSASPLSYRDYIGNETGDLYGFEKDVHEPLPHGLPSRTKIKNVFQTGQHVHMHGITGVAMSALQTCAEWVDKDILLEKIKSYQPLQEE